MNEYLIEVKKGNEVTHVVTLLGDRKTTQLIAATQNNYRHASKFKVKSRAEAIAKKIEGAVVVPSFGGYVNSTKTSVAPNANKINRTTPYRTI